MGMVTPLLELCHPQDFGKLSRAAALEAATPVRSQDFSSASKVLKHILSEAVAN